MLGRSLVGNWQVRKPTRRRKQRCAFASQKLHRTDRPCPTKKRPAQAITQTT